MFVKASGTALKDVTPETGWVKLPYKQVTDILNSMNATDIFDQNSDDQLAAQIDKLTTSQVPTAKASIEAAMHAVLKDFVVHTHPVSVNVFLCSQNGFSLCQEVFRDIPFIWIEPVPPGFYLAKAIEKEVKKAENSAISVIFMASHGLIVHGDTASGVSETYSKVLERAKSKILSLGLKVDQLPVGDWSSELTEDNIFPDTAVFRKIASNLDSLTASKRQGLIETFAASKMIRTLAKAAGYETRSLPSTVCDYILGMSREKHRQAETVKPGGA